MKRLNYLLALLLVILLGLGSRRLSFLPAELGDALWAVAVYLSFRLLLPKIAVKWLALVSLVTSFTVEFSQLIQHPALVAVRQTTLGHLLLGQGFVWWDLLAYSLGIAIIAGLDSLFRD